MPIKDKIEALKKIKAECKNNYRQYANRYKRLKKYDNFIDLTTSILNASSITLILSTPAIPPLFIASAVCSGIQFVVCRVQDKMKIKDKYSQYLTTANQYYSLMNEILIVLHKNHLSNEEYQSYIEEVTDKINLIRDTQIL